jgi:L-asparaginase
MQAFSVNISKSGHSTVVVLGTGGTIAGKAATAQDVLGYTAGQISVETLLGGLDGLDQLTCQLESEQVAQVDSKDIDTAIWQVLAQRISHHLERDEVVGIVVTHGTDTVEETAFFLQSVLPTALIDSKRVVLTCAMRPATALDADGPKNLRDALFLASDGPNSVAGQPGQTGVKGVVVVCAGVVHSPVHVQKVHPTRLNPFDSGDGAILGTISPEGAFLATTHSNQASASDLDQGAVPSPVNAAAAAQGVGWARQRSVAMLQSSAWPRVEIVLNHAGADGALVDALLAQNPFSADPIRGLVVAGTGNGSIHHELLAALLRAQSQGIKVVRSSRCAFGSVQAVAGHALPEISALSPVKARIRLMLDLMQLPASRPLD